jgi:hypothetical protein
MQKVVWYLFGISMALGSAPAVLAHPGHGKDGGSYGLLHYLSEPEHMGVGLALIGLVAAGVYLTKRISSKTKQVGPSGR